MYVTPEEADGTIGFGWDVTDVIYPAKVIANGYTQIFDLCYFKHRASLQNYNLQVIMIRQGFLV